MKRRIEQILAVGGTGISIGSALAVWQRVQQCASIARCRGINIASPASIFESQLTKGESPWPVASLMLFEWGILGLIGLMAVASDSEQGSPHWGSVTWGAIGGLLALMFLGFRSIGPLVFLTVLFFCSAALLADWRQGRRVPIHLALAAAIGIVNGFLLRELVSLAFSS